MSLLNSWLFHAMHSSNGGALSQDALGVWYKQATSQALLAEWFFLALPSISLLYLTLLVHPSHRGLAGRRMFLCYTFYISAGSKTPVHPIPNNLNAFAARSPSNFHYIAMLYAYILVLINTFITILDTIVCVEPGSIQVCFQSYPLRRVCS